jgi:NAD(P)-dependent dehydrogenase (short-subunit alcohol dehydrogenase family)
LRGIKGKIALVTGGATSIGAAIVREFVAEGAFVCIADVADKEGTELAAEMGEAALFVRTDLRSDADIQTCVNETARRFGGIDFLVNVAAIYLDKGKSSSREEWAESFNVNLFGGIVLLQHALPHLIKSGSGAVVNFGSKSGNIAEARRWVYPCTKAAIHQLTRSQALDLAQDNIRVNAVVPGMTWSAPLKAIADANPGIVEAAAQRVHMNGRPVEAEEVARGVLFLCSDEATAITGALLPIDGGSGALGAMGTTSLPRG